MQLRTTCAVIMLVLSCFPGLLLRHDSELIREHYAKTTSGIRIHYLESGKIDAKQALVLIPGWRLPAYLWNEQLSKFGLTIRVIAIDPRSQGPSTKAHADNTPEARARDLHDLLAGVGVSHPVLVGWSQGSQDIAAYLEQFGTDSVGGVVFVDSPVTAGPTEIEIHRQFSKIMLSSIAVYSSHPAEMSEEMVHSLFQHPHPELDLSAIVKFTLQTPTDSGVAMLVSDIFGKDRRPVLAKINKPSLVIASADSPLIDVERGMAASIPGSKFIAIEGTAHAVFVDQPYRFDDALEAFLQCSEKAQQNRPAHR